LEHGDKARAVKLLEVAVQMDHPSAQTWFNLGIAYQRTGKFAEAAKAYQHAADMPGADAEMQQAAQDMKQYLEMGK
jgi:Flp pilus assembly protein TadD